MHHNIVVHAPDSYAFREFLGRLKRVSESNHHRVSLLSFGEMHFLTVAGPSESSEICGFFERGNLILGIEGYVRYQHGNVQSCPQEGGDCALLDHLHDLWRRGRPEELQKLDGKFILIFFDKNNQTLTLARDRLGLKALYRSTVGTSTIYSSRTTPILWFPGFEPSINVAAIRQYLRFRYVFAPETIFSGIQVVHQGTTLDHSSGREDRFWEPCAEDPSTASNGLHVQEFESLLLESISCLLPSNGKDPIGIALSGGLDSSLIATFLRDLCPQREIFTYTAAFLYKGYDESRLAEETARELSYRHSTLIISPQEYLANIPKAISEYQQPLNHPSSVADYLLLRQAASNVRVLLTGECADSILGGSRDLLLYWLSKSTPMRKYLMLRSLGLIERLVRDESYRHRIDRLRGALRASPDEFLLNLGTYSSSAAVDTLLPPDGDELQSRKGAIRRGKNLGVQDLVTWLILDTMPAEEMFRENTAAGFGLSLRFPFAAGEIVDFGLSLPLRSKIRGTKTKLVIRKVARRFLRKELVRAKKSGFGVPLEEWVVSDPGFHELLDLVVEPGSFSTGVFDVDALQHMIEGFRRGARHPREYEGILWTVLNLELWYRLLVRGESL